MSELTERRSRGALAEFKFELARQREIEGDVIIKLAQKTKDWPLLLEAVDQKIEHQQAFVAEWDKRVGVNHGGDRTEQVCRTAYLSVEDAERLSGIKQPTVSKWTSRLRDIPKYRLRLYGPSYRAAMGKMGSTGDGEFAGQSLSNEYYTPPQYIEAARGARHQVDHCLVTRASVIGGMAETLSTSDDVVAAIRERMTTIGVSYGTVEHLSGIGENSISKYLSSVRSRELTIASLLRITEVLGLRLALVVDEELVRKMQPEWGSRDAKRIHARRPALGKSTLKRVLKPVAAELGRRGHVARMRATSGEQRRNIARVAATARWQRAASMKIEPLADPAGPLRVWQVEPPPGAPE
jgi:hypothetical protein